jgi:hypothetical protein
MYVATSLLIGVVRFYMNDGPDGAPGTCFFESEPFRTDPTDEPQTQTLSLGRFAVPDTLTWTVDYSGEGEFYLLGSGPPTVGSSPNLIWYNSGSWYQGDIESSLEARLIAVPKVKISPRIGGLAPESRRIGK